MSACIALAACGPPTESIGAGPISLEYGGPIESGHQFYLENGSSNPIRFRGRTELFSSPRPTLSNTSAGCFSESSGSGSIRGFAIEHGPEPASIVVPPRNKMRLVISGNRFTEPWGGPKRCRLRLRLENGSILESDEFTAQWISAQTRNP